jgi:osmoprotectant transport system substrate-binding protein
LASRPPRERTSIIVGAKDFSEQRILQQIIAIRLKMYQFTADTPEPKGSSLEAHQDLLNHEIDLYVEYTGTAYSMILRRSYSPDTAGVTDEKQIQRQIQDEVREMYENRMQLLWMDGLGFSDSWAAFKQGRSVERLSDVTKDGGYRLVLVVGPQFLERPDGFSALMSAYPARWAAPPEVREHVQDVCKGKNDGNGQSQPLFVCNSTDVPEGGLAKLQDDKGAFLPYQACIVARKSVLDANPGLIDALRSLNGQITDSAMSALLQRAQEFKCDEKPLQWCGEDSRQCFSPRKDCYKTIAREWSRRAPH